jgi:saccharopine dehydrogenase-like NADP-dependent oxidoreductase
MKAEKEWLGISESRKYSASACMLAAEVACPLAKQLRSAVCERQGVVNQEELPLPPPESVSVS